MNEHDIALRQAFAFTPDDLEENRAGHLAPTQRAAMVRYLRRATQAQVGLTGGLGAVGLLATIAFLAEHNLPMVGLSLFLLVTLPLIGYWVLRGERRKWLLDLEHDLADTIYGRVTLTMRERPIIGRLVQLQQYALQVEALEFALSEDQSLAVQDGETYQIYYAPHSAMILSLKSAAEEKAAP